VDTQAALLALAGFWQKEVVVAIVVVVLVVDWVLHWFDAGGVCPDGV
jgi:hypothetical protein